jgi:hypothetical protein
MRVSHRDKSRRARRTSACRLAAVVTAAKRFKIRPGPRAASENAAGRERSPPETVHANTVLQHRQHTLGEDPILYHETYHAAAKRVVAGSAFAGTTKGSWSMLRRMPEKHPAE